MSRPYLTREEKLTLPRYPFWTVDETEKMRKILFKKGYPVIVITTRLGCDKEEHDAWIVPRVDVGVFIEQLSRQRLTVEVEAEGSMQSALTFVYDYKGEDVLKAVRRFQRRTVL